MKKRIILGLDVSTSCLGTSVVSYDETEGIKVLYVHYVKFKSSKKYKGTDVLFYKSQQFKDNFMNRISEWGITDIVIEEPLPNSQNTLTVNTLMKFNGMISQSIYEATGIVPQYISSYDARKYAFPDLISVRKYNKKDEEYSLKKIIQALKHDEVVLFGAFPWDCAKKLVLWNKIVELYPEIQWEYNDKNELKVENFDASDSLICIIGQINKEKYFNSNPKVVEYKVINDNENNDIIKYKIEFCDKIFDKTINLTKNNS